MDSPALVNFPLPMLTALLCGVLAVLVWRSELGIARASAAFSALFALCMFQALLVGLRFGYGITTFIPLQRMLPLFLGPLMYLCFAAMTVGTRGFALMVAAHVGGAMIALILFWFLVADLRHLDWFIGASYLFYAVALYALWRRGPDALICARVDVAERLSNWCLRASVLLIFIFILDTTIALDFALNRGAHASALISYGTAPLIAVLFALLIAVSAMTVRSRKSISPASATVEGDAEIVARLRALLVDEQLFLDPDLTAQRLARRLHLPARDVSGAINRTQNANISQYVNDFRLARAAALLVESDDSVSSIAEASGFLARSNFYREFRRVHDQSPTEFRATRRRG